MPGLAVLITAPGPWGLDPILWPSLGQWVGYWIGRDVSVSGCGGLGKCVSDGPSVLFPGHRVRFSLGLWRAGFVLGLFRLVPVLFVPSPWEDFREHCSLHWMDELRVPPTSPQSESGSQNGLGMSENTGGAAPIGGLINVCFMMFQGMIAR